MGLLALRHTIRAPTSAINMCVVNMYVVDRDFGFAPNPFHGFCTLATCKARIRKRAQIGDWIVGVGGQRLNATGKMIYAMRVTSIVSFNEYWFGNEYIDKKPIRNGSRRAMIGDNIYYFDKKTHGWRQADSHHSNPNGTVNEHNLRSDTSVDRVLISRYFYYFGRSAPIVPREIMDDVGFRNGRADRKFQDWQCAKLLEWIHDSYKQNLNLVIDDPFDFDDSEKRFLGDKKTIK
jgi:hypothetical protein